MTQQELDYLNRLFRSKEELEKKVDYYHIPENAYSLEQEGNVRISFCVGSYNNKRLITVPIETNELIRFVHSERLKYIMELHEINKKIESIKI